MKVFFNNEKLKNIPPHLIIIGILGLVLFIVGNPFDAEDDIDQSDREIDELESEFSGGRHTDEAIYKRELESRMESVLSQIKGTGSVSVMLELESGKKLDVAEQVNSDYTHTTETDGEEGERIIEEETKDKEVITIRSQGDEKPLVLTELKPKIKGVVVVSEGASNLEVKSNLVNAIKTLLDIPSHRIKILPKSN